MRRKIVAGNWKMHGSRAENTQLVDSITSGFAGDEGAECVICPPFVYLHEISRLLRDSSVQLGAQDVCAESQGAFTGEISAAMLKDVGCRYVLVGHSERRALYGEDDALVARKFAAALSRGLVPILCVGEQLAEREAGRTHEVIGAAAGCRPGGLRRGHAGAGGARLRAGLGHRNRPHCDTGAGAGCPRVCSRANCRARC